MASTLLVAHIIAFLWAGVLRKGLFPILALNFIVSAGVVIYWLPRISELLNYVDILSAFVVFEFIVLATSLAALGRLRVLPALIWLEFVAHGLMIVSGLMFMLTFKITRLI